MQAPKGEPGSWVGEEARGKFMAAYERALALWPQPFEEYDVETATTTTRVHAYRPHPGGPPIVLLTGGRVLRAFGVLHRGSGSSRHRGVHGPAG
jgi:hypothetical protein